MKMNESEKEVVRKYVEKGYKYLHSGWPDFVFFKVDGDKITEVQFVEVKQVGDPLRYEQAVMKKIFESLNLPFKVEFINPNQSRPDQSRPFNAKSHQFIPDYFSPNQPKGGDLNEI
jgi:hypothetical protein